MKRSLLRTAVFAAWLILIGWLVRYEAFPERFGSKAAGYRSILSEDVLLDDSWMRVLFNGSPIGYSHSSVEIDETDPHSHYRVDSTVHLKLNVLGSEQQMHVDTSVTIDVLCKLQSFKFKLFSDAYTMRLKGVRAEGESFDISMNTGNSTQKLKVEIPDDVIIHSPMVDMAISALKPGEEMTLKTFDPTSMATINVTIKALRKETLTIGGVAYEATVLSSEYNGATILSWIDASGASLRQETPFGWIMEKCEAEEAFAALREAGVAGDILARLAVTCDRPLKNPRGAGGLKLKLKGVRFTREELQTARQTVETLTDRETVLIVNAEKTASPLSGKERGPALTNDLEATPYVQCQHPDVVARMTEIVGQEADPYRKALAIYDWVYHNVKKEMTVSLPSTLDVLKTMTGDCNEHTYLYVGLARAAGLPSRIKVGLAYQNGAFYYHAWPAVYVGRWMELDPTWGQPGVDATHIALIEGELASQLDLMKIIGQLKIEVIEEF